MKFLIGTFNRGKQQEFARLITLFCRRFGHSFSFVFPQEVGINTDVDETGKSFEANSLLKARYFFKHSGISTIADDEGLQVAALNGEPGVKSRRWLGRAASDDELRTHLLHKLISLRGKLKRRAYFTTCLTYYDGVRSLQTTGRVRGYIADKAGKKLVKDYPYAALFIVSSLHEYYDELTPEVLSCVGHRAQALRKLLSKITRI